ncbi:MAG: bacteriocin family protein [Anaerolineae bacterium]|nr:bacteriocin family protein [Anaerolineae bacterium]
MSDYLMREDAPLTDAEWQHVDKAVVETAKQFLVGRRFLDLAGPFGPGLEIVPVGTGDARGYVELSILDATFMLYWKDIEASRKMGVPLETGAAARAAMACARMEDELILSGLIGAAEKSVSLGDWTEPDAPLGDIVKATEALFSDGFFGPYAVVLSPDLYTQTQRVSRGMGRMVSKLINDIVTGGMFRTQLLDEGQGLVLSLGAYNFDLVVGQDLVAAYQGNEGLDHSFRVMETLALRVKRGGAICKLG